MNCPKCRAPLGIRISAGGVLFCHACGSGLGGDFLTTAGLPAEIQKRILHWGTESGSLYRQEDREKGWGEEEFLAAWKRCRDDIPKLAAELDLVFPVPTVVQVNHALEETAGFSDAELLRWRRRQVRDHWIRDYGQLMGIQSVSEGHPAPSEDDVDKIPCPREFTGEERTIFQGSFLIGAVESGPTTEMGLSGEIADLKRKLGLSR